MSNAPFGGGNPPVTPVALVTGGDSGIGRAVAVKLAEQGMDVGVTWHRDLAGAEKTAREVREKGHRCAVAQLDLADLPGGVDVIGALADELGRVDVLVNCAGTGTSTRLLDLEHSTVQQVLDVDLIGPFLCSQNVARRMIAQGTGGASSTSHPCMSTSRAWGPPRIAPPRAGWAC